MSKRTASNASSGKDGRDKKRARLDSRRIRVQHTDNAMKDGILDVPTFLKTREFEIKQLEQTMENSKKSGSKRTFQKVPRELRRRTASHNAKRVPKRLQTRAVQEMAEPKQPNKKLGRGHERVKHLATEKARTKETNQAVQQAGVDKKEYEKWMHNTDLIGIHERAEAPRGKFRYKARQREKVWLPTHIWHAKRAHMESHWGYAVARRPTQKCYRPTHRASIQTGAVAWDSSYFDCLVVEPDALALIGCQDALKKRYEKRPWEGIVRINNEVVGPALVYRGGDDDDRVLLRIHPAMFDRVFDVIGEHSHDCRYAIGSIDITGPKSLAALRAVLKPREGNPLWNKLAAISNSDSLPPMQLPLDVYDARLFSPNFKVNQPTGDLTDAVMELATAESRTSLLDTDARQESYAKQPSLKQLHKRSQPGKDIQPVETDPSIPTLLLKHSECYTLLLPWHWVQPFWHQLMSIPNVRLGGLDQRHQLAFENSRLFFPNDYICTPAGLEVNAYNIQQNKDKYEARPKAKRPNYAKLGEVGNPFGCDWSLLSAEELSPVRLECPAGTPRNNARIFSNDKLVGFVTSGNYNLKNGYGCATGWAATTTTTTTSNNISNLVVRNVGSSTTRKCKSHVLPI